MMRMRHLKKKMKESLGNVVGICKSCAKDRIKSTKQIMNEYGLEVQGRDFVKLTFKDENGTEHMWVEVTGFVTKDKKKCIIGRLDNVPEIVKSIEYNDIVTMPLDSIGGFMREQDGIKIEINVK